jgi:signal transduction histidine kinase
MTIRQKLTLYWAAVMTALVLVSAFAVFAIFSRQQWGALDAALLEEADTSAGAVARADGFAGTSIVRRLSEERDLGPGRRVRLSVGDKVVADYGSAQADLPVLSADIRARDVVDGSRQVYRFALMPIRIGSQPALLEDGVDATPVRNSIARLRTILFVMIPLLLLASVAGGYWLAGRSLAPIISLSDELARIDPRELHRRLAVGAAGDEVDRLTVSINALLDRLERASQTERRFLSDAAHELRTPLAVLRTGLEVALNRERGAGELREALLSAMREVVALCAAADEVLTLARLSEESFGQRFVVNLDELAREVIDAVEPLVHAKKQTLEFGGDRSLEIEGNRDHLRRLLINLLDNAIKFTLENGRIRLSLEHQADRAIIRVADNGPGIAQADLPFIFERFFRPDGSKSPGSGLGLSLCREIVRLHQGEISARNLAEGGCEFVVGLPIHAPQATANKPA